MTKRPRAKEKDYAHTLSVRLTAAEFRQLRLHIIKLEEQTGRQASQQTILKTALADYLTKMGG
jgi:hypothetical protein